MKRAVYLIDDDEGVLAGLSFLLSTAGYQPFNFRSGLDFLENFPNEPQGCIVMDVRMPGVNGIALTAQLRGRGLRLPIIVISGHGDITLALQAVRAGAYDFIEKPFDDEALLDALAGALSGQMPPLPPDDEQLRDRLAALPLQEQELLSKFLAGWENQQLADHFGMDSYQAEQWVARTIGKLAKGNLSTLLRSLLALRRADLR